MKVDLDIIESEFKLIESWNLTHRQKNLVYYPKFNLTTNDLSSCPEHADDITNDKLLE